MATEFYRPVEVEGQGRVPQIRPVDVHGDFNVHAKYANGVTMHISGKNPNGVRFEGDEAGSSSRGVQTCDGQRPGFRRSEFGAGAGQRPENL